MTDKFAYADVANGRAKGTQRLFCEPTLKGGKVVWDWNVRTAQDSRKLGNRCGMREVDHIVLPKE